MIFQFPHHLIDYLTATGEIDRKIKSLLYKGFIEPSRSLYRSPIVPMVKPNGQLRICVDYKALNRKTMPRTYLIPRVEDLIERLGGSKYFTVLDLKDPYWHISVKEEDRPNTAFVLGSTKMRSMIHDPYDPCNPYDPYDPLTAASFPRRKACSGQLSGPSVTVGCWGCL